MAFVGMGICMDCGDVTVYIQTDIRRCLSCWKDFVWDWQGLKESYPAPLPDIPDGKLFIMKEEDFPNRVLFPLFEVVTCPTFCLRCGAGWNEVEKTRMLRVHCDEEVVEFMGKWIVVSPMQPMKMGRRYDIIAHPGCVLLRGEEVPA